MFYWNLSYKKKFIWNISLVPVVIALIIWSLLLDDISSYFTVILNVILITLTSSTLIYTYKKWKKEE